jgi:hypothetical protein
LLLCIRAGAYVFISRFFTAAQTNNNINSSMLVSDVGDVITAEFSNVRRVLRDHSFSTIPSLGARFPMDCVSGVTVMVPVLPTEFPVREASILETLLCGVVMAKRRQDVELESTRSYWSAFGVCFLC